MNRSLFVNTLTGKHVPMVRLLLAIKKRVTGVSFLYYYLAIFKLLGLLILTMSFIPRDETSYGYRLTKVLRSITTFGIFGTSLTYSSYTLGSYFIFFILLSSMGLFIYTYKLTKKKEDFIITFKAKILSFILAIILQVLLVLSHHLIEYFSFIFAIQFNSGVDNSMTPYYYLIKDHTLFMNSSLSVDAYILMLINLLGIVFLNIFMYFAFKILNEPFFDTDFPVRMRYPDFSMILYVVFQNLQCIHYLELFFINDENLKIYKFVILGVVNLLLVIGFFKTYHSFNFSNGICYVINFLLCFSFFSSVLEVSLYLAINFIDSMQQLFFTTISKLFISLSFVIISHLFNEKLFISRLKTSLFKPYNGKISETDLESIFYLINLLIKLENSRNEEFYKLMDIILTHKTECAIDYCKCTSINDYTTDKLLNEINLILESIFTNLNLGKEQFINILFAEYLYYQRKSTLFAWSIMNTYISKNTGIVSNIKIYQFFLILMRKVYQFDDVLKTTENYVHFNMVFREVAVAKFYEKKILRFMENFENFVKFKERFDSSLKVDHTEGKIDSYVFQTELSLLVENCRKYENLYKKMKAYIRKDFGHNRCKSVELGYRLYSFFIIFNKKVPSYIISMICNESTLDKSSSLAVQKYFNASFQKFFTNNKSPMNMIIEINKMFKIKYVNNKLCQALGHSYNKIINDDIHQLFPSQLREPHKKVLLNHFLIQKKVFFRKKTFAFTSSNNLFPLDLMVSTFPNLKKNLQAVVSINPVETYDTRSFFFVVTEFYELLAISDNFNTYYSLNYDLIDKLGVNMLKLFNIEGLIPVKFKTQLENIKRERYMKQFDHLYSLSYFLFNLGGEEDERPPQTRQVGPSNGEGEKSNNKQFGTTLLGGVKGVKSKKEQGKNNKKIQKDTAVFSRMGTVSGKIGEDLNESLRKDNFSSTITPAGVQNSLVEMLQKSNRVENSSTTYTNYQKGKVKDEKQKLINSTPEENQGETPTHEVKTDADKISDFTVIRDKRLTIQNLEILKNRCKDMEIGSQYYDRICECLSKLKKSCGITDNDKVETSKPNLIRNKFKNKTPPKTIKSYSENFHINVSFRKINDAPFFIVGIKEKTVYRTNKTLLPKKNNLSKELSVIGETPDELHRIETQQSQNANPIPKTINFKNKLGKRRESSGINTPLKSSTLTVKRDSLNPQFNFINSLKEEAEKKELEKKKREEEILNNPNGILNVSAKKKKSFVSVVALSQEKINKQEAQQRSERRKEIITTIILGIFLVFNLIVASIVLYFKLYIIEVTQDFFTVNFWRMRHETILTALHSACLTYAFLLTDVTSFQTKYLNSINVTIPVAALPLVINERSTIVRDTFAHFFTAVKSSRYKLDSLEHLLYNKTDSYKGMIITWDSIQYNSTYINLINFIVSKAKALTIETELNDYITDINEAILFRQFDNLKNEKAKSKHSNLLYFLNENIQKLEQTFIEFKNALVNSETEFKESWRKMTTVVEILNIVLALILIFVIHYTLNRFDRNLFKILVSMFLNMRKGKKADFKGTLECQLIKMRMRNLKNLLNAFKIENIKLLDESLNIDEYGINKILMKNYMKNHEGSFGLLLGNATLDTSAPSKDPLLNATLGGSLLGLNSSKTPLAGSTPGNELGINELKQGENNDSSITPGASDKSTNKIEEKKDDKKPSPKRKKSKQKEVDEELEVNSFITNGQILKKSKHYSIKFVFISKVLITLVFLLYIVFILSNVVTNTVNFNLIDSNMALVSSYVMVFPEINRIFNMIRLTIINNDLSYTSNYPYYLAAYYQSEADSNILYDQFETKLPESYEYYSTLNSLDYERRSALMCKDTVVQDFCKEVLKKENGFNREGLKIATNTVLQTIIDIYKDYLKIRDSSMSSQTSALTSKPTLLRYFKTEEFGNVNCEMCLVFLPTTISYFNSINSDMSRIFEDVINLNIILGITSICLNIIIILYIVLIFFRRLSESKDYINYSAAKFNRALFEA
jgi:PAS domain S-box-containing protein